MATAKEFEDEEGEKDGRLEVSYLVTVEENEAANISLLMEDEDAVHIVEGTLRELLENAPLETSDVVFILGEMTVEARMRRVPYFAPHEHNFKEHDEHNWNIDNIFRCTFEEGLRNS
eukprot:197470-Amphidinium_carterae.1